MTVGAALSGTQRIARAFARARETKRLAIVVYLTVGYPDRAATGALVRAALDGGADVLELGVPFSDPLADGATVQRASEVALHQGVTLADCIAEASTVVRERDATVLLMGYTNPFLRYRGGLRGFAPDAAQAGAAGIIVPDLPAEEAAEFDVALDPEGLARIDLYAPTTPDDRLSRLVPSARGFVYCVSLTGITGARRALGPDVADFVGRVRRHTSLPIAVGFGISNAEHVASLRGIADAVVVGSAALDTVSAAPADRRPEALHGFVSALVAAGKT
ncbi:MAG: tryptophan synthase subunit alpha [Chloroflexi bacterium]|nr:MAG: tryptophan synthase subunit alpha [Chloroflexota bacterium]